ncbi:MAG: type II toxin-antitoxin system VapC family toxin [Armatimonadetes bacterium]|nr:type II toxin-antitoxin system VapC family toxin [Armatimonadota bacterium]
MVYVEATIPIFYHEVRTEPEMVARRQWTRQWWDNRRADCDVVTSRAVLDELADGDYPTKDEVLALVQGIRLLSNDPPVAEIVDVYIARSVMPRDPLGDALHLALASYHHCEFLLTWNCIHLANANKFRHIQRVDSIPGLGVPSIVTPLELLGGQADASGG